MRRRVSGLVAATTSAVVLAFVIPLCLMVRGTAEDQAMAAAGQEARNIAIVVSSLRDSESLPSLVEAIDERFAGPTSVLLADGAVLGAPAPDLGGDPLVLQAQGGSAFTQVAGGRGSVLVPVVSPGGVDVVRTTVPEALLRYGVTRSWAIIVLLGLAMILVAVVAADRLGRRVAVPVVHLAGVADRLREGDLEARARIEGPPETVALAEALNRLAARIRELLAMERASVGDLSHRLRTPLTALRLDVEGVRDPVVAERLRQHVGRLERSVDAIVKEARRPVREDVGGRCDLVAVVRSRVDFWSALAEEQDRPVKSTVPDHPVVVLVHRHDIEDVLDVAVDNVFAHTAEGTGFAVTVRAADNPSYAELVVRDDGPAGTAPLASPRPGRTGLGLDIARRTTRGFGGQLEVEAASVGRGTVFTVRIPLD